jgi:kumamolisin
MTMLQYADQIVAGVHNNTLSYDEFSQKFSTSPEDMLAVQAFASVCNLSIVEAKSEAAMVKVSGTVELFNSAFQISLKSITAPGGKQYIGYTGTLSIPAELNQIVEFVIGLNNAVVMKHLASKADLENRPFAASPAGVAYSLLTPLQVAAAYNFPASNGYGQCVGLIEYGGGYTTQNLTSSFSPLSIANPTVVAIDVDGGTNNPADPSGSSVEVMLDIFVVGAVAPASKIAVYFGAGSGDPIPGPNWYDPVNTAIHDTTNSPSVLSISWGESESSFGSSNMTAMDSVLAQAAVLGITICVASGDSGSTWDALGVEVLYPGSSPYVLSCGGTSLAISGSTITSEVVWNESANSAGAGGGGISIYESTPAYQSGLTYKIYPAGTVSSLTVRGVPDVAGNADPYSGYSYYYGNSNTHIQGVGGTSGVAPLWAGLIARLNALTGTRRGLFNTLLYANSSVCNDITSGNNLYTPYGVSYGYSATTGWDACTGLGSPNGTNIFRLINTGSVYPSNAFGFRPSSGAVYPRLNTGLRAT